MKVKQVQLLLNEIEKTGLNPNEYFTLFTIILGQEPPKGINLGLVTGKLIEKGWTKPDGSPTEKASHFELDKNIDITAKVEEYRSLWPKGVLPSGKPAKSPVKDLELRFKWFFKNYDFDWDLILKATESYIVRQAEIGNRFMRTSSYFIYKQDTPQLRTSSLAEWCETIKDGGVEETYDINI